MKLANLVKNKYFCYFTYALMVINLLGYVSVGAMECVVVFALATFACKSCLTKNMCLCIIAGLFVSNILFGCSKVKEGFREGMGHQDDKCSEENKSKIITQISELQDELDACDAEAEDSADDGDSKDDSSAPKENANSSSGNNNQETFRNMRRGRRRAVRGAIATLRRAVNSY